ncbi:MAG TPA: GTP-binding protein [Niabella sp.]
MNNNQCPPIAKPVTIISGFLGAGKTTFLNALIAFYRAAGKKLLVIENELGEQSIDGELIVDAGSDIFELSNGCLCCNLNEDLYDLLRELWQRGDTFDELIIETTGIADPATVAVPFLADPSIERYYRLERVIGVVDACLIETTLLKTAEAGRQISFSDLLLVTKTDMIAQHQVADVVKRLQQINPFAKILTGNKTLGYPLPEISGFMRSAPTTAEKETKHVHSHQHAHHRHHNITSLSFVFTVPIDIEKLEYRLMLMLNLQSENIYRVKGIIDTGYKKVVLQSVAHYLAITEGKDWLPGEEHKSRIVFIGKELKAAVFEKILEQCTHETAPFKNSVK